MSFLCCAQPGEMLDWFFRRARNHSASKLETFGYLIGGESDGGLVVGGLFLPEEMCPGFKVRGVQMGCHRGLVSFFFTNSTLTVQCELPNLESNTRLHEDWKERGWKVVGLIQTHWRTVNTMSVPDLCFSAAMQVRLSLS